MTNEMRLNMKTKHWIIIIAIALAASLGLGAWLLLGQQEKHYVTVIQDGKITMTLDLSKDKTLTLTSANGGSNTVEIKDNKVAVTSATCPDHICMSMGWCDSGMPIACLPNGLILTFTEDPGLDGAAG